MQDSQGLWLFGFYRYCGYTTNMHAELLAILNGMHHIWNNGFRHNIVEIDFLASIHLIEQQSLSLHLFVMIVTSIKSLLALQWEVRIIYTLQEVNVLH